MNGHEMLARKAPITFEVACKAWGGDPNFYDDATRKCFFAVWALLCFEWAEAMVEHEQSLKATPGAQTAPSVPDENAAFEAWFSSEQGTPYDGMWSFARAAWMARARLAPGAQENNDAPL